MPKQFLPLLSDRSFFQETALRLNGIPDLASPLVICNSEHRFLASEQLRSIGITPFLQLLEPIGRNTAPATAVAALSVLEADKDAILLVLPADHLIQDDAGFRTAVQSAVLLAQQDKLVTFGITPNEPATGLGYIERGDTLDINAGAFSVKRFVEKPDIKTAQVFLDSGHFFWNSGMFVFKASVYLDELKLHRPDIFAASQAAWLRSSRDLDFCRLDSEAFSDCPSDSIDYAVMEHTQSAAVVTIDIGWSDVGSWSSLSDVSPKDSQNNVLRGDVYARETKNCYIRTEGRMVAAIGVQDLIIVETADAVLVMHKDRAQDVKHTVDYLKQAERNEHLVHRRVYRPWGYYDGIDIGEHYQAKRIMVKPGAKLSLQMHHHRAEHWIIVSGIAKVTCGDESKILHENQSTYIPIGTKHRLENVGDSELYLIEVQSGSYLGEDDIVRFDDVYKRA